MGREDEVLEAGVAAVVYGLPLLMMDATMRTATNVARPRGVAAPVNRFGHMRTFPTAAFRQVVRANVDTLYSSAFLDLSKEPLVLSVPDTRGRYYLLPLFDAWTNVFASPGTRTTGNGAGDFAIVGPGWAGILPQGLRVLRSPTNTVWILGRTQTNGPEDYAAVHAVQDGYRLTPLSSFGKDDVPSDGTVDPQVDMATPPVQQVQSMGAAQYFDALARLLRANPPPASDAQMVARLAMIGIVPGHAFDPSHLQPSEQAALERCVLVASQKLQGAATRMGQSVNGWHVPDANLGNYGDDYALRAYIALIAFGANLPADAVYPTAFVDSEGQRLDGANRYVLRFEPGMAPPADAFWSVTLYGDDSFFVANPIERQAISSWMPLQRGSDGSIELYIQREAPDATREANWLPCGEGRFNLTMRIYRPRASHPSILDGSWQPPAMSRV